MYEYLILKRVLDYTDVYFPVISKYIIYLSKPFQTELKYAYGTDLYVITMPSSIPVCSY